ncbi:hypothetical protein [uncultured Neglectibacter sp.]|uniref:hypothetical protein n=1 Tax=uncultured Neglectibacter sp. TaxID=1924108 RepID=UPI0034DFE072
MKKALSLLLVLALSLAIFALPAAAETHDHDGCAACAEEIQPRVRLYKCLNCGLPCTYTGRVGNLDTYKCYDCNLSYTIPAA